MSSATPVPCSVELHHPLTRIFRGATYWPGRAPKTARLPALTTDLRVWLHLGYKARSVSPSKVYWLFLKRYMDILARCEYNQVWPRPSSWMFTYLDVVSIIKSACPLHNCTLTNTIHDGGLSSAYVTTSTKQESESSVSRSSVG